MLAYLQSALCLLLLLLTGWQLNHMEGVGRFPTRLFYTGSSALGLVGLLSSWHPNSELLIAAGILLVISGAHYVFLQPSRFSGHDRRGGDRRATAD